MRYHWMVITILIAAGAEVFGAIDYDEIEPELRTSVQWLTQIDRITQTGQLIDIALNNIGQDEECYFRTPSGQIGNKDIRIDGVTTQNSSELVSCRITVGPMDNSLLGMWTLCGKYEELERCQNVNIVWLNNNNNNQGAAWVVTQLAHFNHSVSLNRYLTPSLNGTGTTRSCHIITPHGEDLLITAESRYPGIQLETATASATCAITIGPIERSMLGEWILYGIFRHKFTVEVRQSMTFSLYDEDNPYVQPYNVTNLNLINRITNLGSNATVEVTGTGNIDSCQYRAPDGLIYQFDDLKHFPGVTIPNVGHVIVCRLLIGPVNESMLGEWQIIGQFSSNGIFTERRQPFNLIQGAGDAFPDVEIDWLPQIDRITRIGEFVDIALNNLGENEICYFENPVGGQGNNEIAMYGVIVHERSEFVSCRITVGPMEASFLGTWKLCGRRGNNNQFKRCQSVNIEWLNANNGSAAWSVSQQALFNHSVSLGRYLRPSVTGSGTVRSCHVVTPFGEDLVITNQTQYPGIQLETVSSTAVCAFIIGPIERWMLGEWTVYGKFRRQVTTEVRLPIILSLYDEDNPYTQPYNITNLVPINRITNMGSNTTVDVTGDGNIDNCQYRAPDGVMYQFDDSERFPGVTTPDVGSAIVCRLTIGPIEEKMLGDWELIGQFSVNGSYSERRQPFTLIRGAGDEFPKVEPEWLPLINRITRTGATVDIALYNIGEEESCSFENPTGGQGNDNIEMFGVTVHESSKFVSCRITVGPMEDSLLGNWTLCGRHGSNNQYKRCQPVYIEWLNANNPSAAWSVSQQTLFNHSVNLGGFLRPSVNGSGTVRSCHVVTPFGEDLVITNETRYPGIHLETVSSTSVCVFIIGPIERWMLGEWTVYGQFRRQVTSEARLPMMLSLFDEENPYDQPYNITKLNTFNRIIHLGSNTTVEVNGNGIINSCRYVAPDGNMYNFTDSSHFPGVTIPSVGNTVVCRIVIGPIEEKMLGDWQIVGRFSNNGIFSEIWQPFTLVQEDPKNPVIEDRNVTYLAERHFNTSIGTSERAVISRARWIVPETCHIRTPAGRQYIMSENFNMPGVTPLEGSDIECGVLIDVISEDMVGEWVLISRALNVLEPIERRMPFVIHVEERVEAFPQSVTITEENDLIVRLRNPTEQYESCRLVGPRTNISPHEIDESHTKSCGFIVKSIQPSDQGIWEIVYGTRIVYRAAINVTVIDRQTSFDEDLVLIKDDKVSTLVGPEDAVYCRLEDPTGFAVFDDFGRCQMEIERVTREHNGVWKIQVAAPGRVLLEEFNLFVVVKESESTEVVTTKVEKQRPSVVLSCSLSTSHNVRGCKFRNPRGNTLIAAKGVGEDRYSFYGSEVSYVSNVRNHECGIRIANPSQDDLGLWRCAIETEGGSHYGFLSVICPLLMQNPDVQASVVTEPTLSAVRSSVSAIEGEAVTMSCSIQAPIRYCYFRASNGTVFVVTPETSSPSMEYAGSGFDAGECGVRFRGLASTDSGRWSCHVGLYNQTEEQRANLQLTVQEPISVRHYRNEAYRVMVEAVVHSERRLDYCRFIRIDGFGFTTDSIPDGYRFSGSLDSGHCLLSIRDENNLLNLHPWTVVAKIRGQRVELFKQTTDNLLWMMPDHGHFFPLYIWFLIILMILTVLLLGAMLGPKKNRQWTYDRASQLRDSFRNSFRKTKELQNP